MTVQKGMKLNKLNVNIETLNISWSNWKNEKLKRERGVSFEIIEEIIRKDSYIDVIDNSNYPQQKILIVNINNYIYCVPFVDYGETIVLKTIYANRKLNKIYNLTGNYES